MNARGDRCSGFDKLARAYRWMEYATFGPLLQRTRLQFLPAVTDARRVLVLGDGDGRFCVALLRTVPAAEVVAVDSSAAMLARLRQRAQRAGVNARLTTVHGDALAAMPPGRFDLVCTHFFLDCLDDAQVRRLTAQVRQGSPVARWLVSEFAVPRGVLRWPAWLVVRSLYGSFRVLTSLRVRRLPDYPAALRADGFVLQASRRRAGGLLCAELWRSGPRAHPTV